MTLVAAARIPGMSGRTPIAWMGMMAFVLSVTAAPTQ